MLTDRKTCTISVIVPALDEGSRIEACLGNLAARAGVEVILVDGGSSDNTCDKAVACGARVIVSPAGRGRQMNTGAQEARGDILLFLHADTILPADFQGRIADAAEVPGFAAGAFRFAIDGKGRAFRIIEVFTNLRARLLGMPYGDQGIFLAAKTFRALGGYAEMPILEDVDLVRRLRRFGRVVIVPSPALTSARRWQRLGAVRTIVINQLILLGFFFRISPFRLASWYRQRGGR